MIRFANPTGGRKTGFSAEEFHESVVGLLRLAIDAASVGKYGDLNTIRLLRYSSKFELEASRLAKGVGRDSLMRSAVNHAKAAVRLGVACLGEEHEHVATLRTFEQKMIATGMQARLNSGRTS